MALSDLRDCPPSLLLLFPECQAIEDKAFKFLELKYECGTYRRTSRMLKELHKEQDLTIHHQTVKNLFEFLKDTDVYYRFQEVISEQVEDFYSRKLMVTLFERYELDIQRAEKKIAFHLKMSEVEREEIKDGTIKDITVRGLHEKAALDWLKFKKSLLDKMANISLTVRGHYRKPVEEEDEAQDRTSKAMKDLLEEADEHESGRDRH